MDSIWSTLVIVAALAVLNVSAQDGGCTAEPKCKTEVKCKPDPPKCPEPEKKCEKKCETKMTCTNPCERPTPCGQTRCGGLCMDRMYGCSYYAQQGYCQSPMFYAFMQNYCCATCRAYYGYYRYGSPYGTMQYSPQYYMGMMQGLRKKK